MSSKSNTSEGHDLNHSSPSALPLVDLNNAKISVPTSIDSTVAKTQKDEMHDSLNNITDISTSAPELIPKANSNNEQQLDVKSDVTSDDQLEATSTPVIHQNDVDSDMEKEDRAIIEEDSNSSNHTNSITVETSDHVNSQLSNGPPQSDHVDIEAADEDQTTEQHNNTDTSHTTPVDVALDDGNFSNADSGILRQGPADSNEQQQRDTIDFDFDGGESNNDFDGFGNCKDDDDGFNDFNDFGEVNNEDDDDFGDFGDFDEAGNLGADNDDDDFGDFGDLPEAGHMEDDMLDATSQEDLPLESITSAPSEPTLANQYIQVLQTDESNISTFIESTLSQLWTPVDISKDTVVASPTSINGTSSSSSPSQHSNYDNDELLCTQCSLDLWQKVSRDSVFYNPITGSIGQFQWTRSEINRAYLNALGVRINYEDRLQDNRPTSMTSSPSLQHRHYSQGVQPSSTYGSPINTSPSSSPSMSRTNDRSTNHMRSSSLTDSISLTGPAAVTALHGGVITGPSKPPAEEEPELDIDIAKAYCELTEETIRVFPDVKLNAMVVELSRLQRQAKEYLGYLLDQREQLMMDAETYNDLISCIVGHAQRLREQNVAKDASPAMVSKKKKQTGLSGMIKRKNTTGSGTGGTSMGGGVVGVKQSSTSTGSKSTNAGEGRRSL